MIDAGLQGELQAALPMLAEQARRNAGQDGIKRAIEPWFATFQQPQRSDPEWAAFWRGYELVCGPFAEQALHGAMRAWAKLPEAEWLPKPGRLAELARQQPTAGLKLYALARSVASEVDKRLGILRVQADHDERKTTPDEQRRAVTELLGGFEAQSKDVRDRQRKILQRGRNNVDKPGAAYRMPPGQTAEGSPLTPQMLKHLGRPVPTPSAQVEAHRNDDDGPPSEML